MNIRKIELPFLLQRVYEQIPEIERRRILNNRKGAMNKIATSIRVQPYIPNEIYVMLHYFNAFMGSESDFFTQLACEYIEKKAAAQGLMNMMKQGGR